MVSKRKPYNIYPGEFKLEAIRLMNESDRPANQIAMELVFRLFHTGMMDNKMDA